MEDRDFDESSYPCQSHCCALHGCKYGYAKCAVVLGRTQQDFPCEACFADEAKLENDARTISALQARVMELETAIRSHREAFTKSKEVACHLKSMAQTNVELYKILNETDEGAIAIHDTLPPQEVFLDDCIQYYREIESQLLCLKNK